MLGFIFTSISPLLTLSPSCIFSWVISPLTSGAIFTSVSGYILPLAVTVSVMVCLAAFSTATFVSSLLDLLATTIKMISTTKQPITIHHLDFILSSFILMELQIYYLI